MILFSHYFVFKHQAIKYEITRHSVSEEIRTVKMWTVLYNTKYVFKKTNRNVWITYYILNGNLLYFYRKQFNKSYNVLAWHSDFHRSIPTLWCWHQHYVNAMNLFQFKYNKSMLLYVISVKLRKLCMNCKKELLKSYFSVFPNCFIFQSRHTGMITW